MNKLLVLKERYPKMSESTFNTFVDADDTPTKKYLSYYLKVWTSKKGSVFTSNKLIERVKQFDELLPYIKNKDIYSSEYERYINLEKIVLKAIQDKEEKTFVREENAKVLYEDNDTLFLMPLTYKGSLKYGSNTKWCVASMYNSAYFTSYTKKGYLCYLIDKTNTKISTTNKVAFFMENNFNGNEMLHHIQMWNDNDVQINFKKAVLDGWDQNLLVKLVTIFRIHCTEHTNFVIMKKSIDSTIKSLEKLNFDELYQNIETIEKYKKGDYTEEKEIINKFVNNIKKLII